MGNKNSTSQNAQAQQQYMSNVVLQQQQIQGGYHSNYLNNNIFNDEFEDPSPQQSSYDDDEPLPESTTKTESKPDAKKEQSTLSDPEKLFSCTFKLKYNTLQINSASETIEPALFTLKTENTQEGSRVPLDLVCVLDVSGSMQGTKITLLKDTLKYLVEILGDDDRISIVKFNSQASRLTPLQRVAEANKPGILKAIDSLYASGGTSITAGMTQAVRILNDRRYKNPVSSVFLLSDGLDGGATAGVQKLLQTEKPKDSFTINSFGYGSDHDPNLMNSIAKLMDGKFYFVEKLDTVDECFVHAIGGLISVVGQDTTITIQAVKSDVFPNVQIKKAFGGSELWKVVDGTYNTGISQLSSGKSKNYVLELAIPKCTKTLSDLQREVVLAKATVTIKLPNSNEVWKKVCELKVNFVNEDEELPKQQAEKDLLSNYYRVRAAELLAEARNLAEKSDYEGGRKILQNFKEELSKSAVKDESLVKGLLDDIELTIKEMQPRVYEAVGKARLYQQVDCHMMEKSNPMSNADFYSNCTEQMFVKQAKAKKGFF